MLKHGKPEFTGNYSSHLVVGQIRVVDFQVILLIEKIIVGIQLVSYGVLQQSFSPFLYISFRWFLRQSELGFISPQPFRQVGFQFHEIKSAAANESIAAVI